MTKKKSEPEAEPTYEVESIYAARVTRKSWAYNIKWSGYPEEDNSWEPEKNLTGCRRLLSSFWKQFGPEIRLSAPALPQDHIITPTSEWIECQRELYKRNHERKEAQRRKGKPTAARNVIGKDNSDVEDSEEEATEEIVGDEDVKGEVDVSQDESAIIAEDIPVDIEQSKARYSDPDDVPLSLFAKRRPREHTPRTDEDSVRHELKRRKIDKDDVGLSREPPTKRRRGILVAEAADDPSASPDAPLSPAGSLFDEESNDETPLASTSEARSSRSGVTNTAPVPTSKMPALNQHHVESPLSQSSLPATTNLPTGSIDINVPPPPKVPAHVQRRLNPRIKMINLPPATGTRGISTKVRIAAGEGRENLVSPSSPLARPRSAASLSPVVDADRWLRENVVTDEGSRESIEPQSPAVPAVPSAPSIPHFSKRWRWTGQLAVGDNESDSGFAEPVGEIVLSDNTSLDRSVSHLGIHLLFSDSIESLCLRHCYPLSTLSAVMADFRISQFARMTANKASHGSASVEHEGAFEALVAYMIKNEMARYSVSELNYSDQHVATMFIFPWFPKNPWQQANLPPVIQQKDGLIISIGFQVFKPAVESRDLIETTTSDWKDVNSLYLTSPMATQAPDSGRALMTLRFPDSLYKRIAGKPYTIFTLEEACPDPDTLALKAVLANIPGCKNNNISDGDTRCIFIHVSSWSMLHKQLGLVDRRLRRPDVLFFTYGSDPTVDSSLWGLQDVFPIGGIVTFTPRAIAENPVGVEKLIVQLSQHPLWTCYVLPSTIAMIVSLINHDGTDSESKLKSIVEVLSTILIPIEKGQVSLTWHPPPLRSWYQDKKTDNLQNKYEEWRIQQMSLLDLQGYDLVIACQKMLNASQDQTEKDVENTIVKDFVVMQSLFRREYRRFVIITDSAKPCNTSKKAAAKYSTRTADIRDQFEITNVEDFTFNDDYFKTEPPAVKSDTQ